MLNSHSLKSVIHTELIMIVKYMNTQEDNNQKSKILVLKLQQQLNNNPLTRFSKICKSSLRKMLI